MLEDAELLLRYGQDRSEAAFAELVNRHIGLVYSAALRRANGDSHRAADVTQAVFLALARHAERLARHPVLAAWLRATVRNAAATLDRADRRHQHRKQQAQTMHEIESTERPSPEWDSLRPVLEESLDELSEQDQQAVILRFFEGRSFPEIGRRLSLREDTARVRVARALDKLRSRLARRGITSTSAAVGAVLTQQAVNAAVPSGLAASVTGAVLAGVAAKTGAGVLVLMSINKAMVGMACALAVAGVVGFVVQQQANTRLHDEIAGLRQQIQMSTALRSENQRLSRIVNDSNAELEALRAEHSELVHARDEIAAFRAHEKAPPPAPAKTTDSAATVPLAPGMVGKDAWTNAGRAMPRSTYQTALWAADRGEVNTLAETLTFNAAEKAKVDALFAMLPEDMRTKYGSPEQMIALLFAGGQIPTGLDIVSETPQGPNAMIAHVRIQLDGGRVKEADLPFVETPVGWKLVVPADRVEATLRRLTGTASPGDPTK